jgi:hypothetical protein
MPDQVSAETVAWIAAAGTAAGALIGSSAGGVVQFVLDRARERRRAKAGARLVRLDLSLIASALRDSEHDLKWWVFRDETVLASWEQYAEAIAPRLTPEQFEDVTQAVGELTRWVREIRKTSRDESEPYWTLPPSMVENLKTFRENATKAHNALADLAGEKPLPERELLHEDQAPTP